MKKLFACIVVLALAACGQPESQTLTYPVDDEPSGSGDAVLDNVSVPLDGPDACEPESVSVVTLVQDGVTYTLTFVEPALCTEFYIDRGDPPDSSPLDIAGNPFIEQQDRKGTTYRRLIVGTPEHD